MPLIERVSISPHREMTPHSATVHANRRITGCKTVFAVAAAIFAYLVMTGERGLSTRSQQARVLDVTRLSAEETKNLGWDAGRLNAVFEHAATLSTDTFVVATSGQTVGAFGDLKKPYDGWRVW